MVVDKKIFKFQFTKTKLRRKIGSKILRQIGENIPKDIDTSEVKLFFQRRVYSKSNFGKNHEVSQTHVLKKSGERVATIYESMRHFESRHVAVISHGDFGLTKAIGISYFLGFIPKDIYLDFLMKE